MIHEIAECIVARNEALRELDYSQDFHKKKELIENIEERYKSRIREVIEKIQKQYF